MFLRTQTGRNALSDSILTKLQTTIIVKIQSTIIVFRFTHVHQIATLVNTVSHKTILKCLTCPKKYHKFIRRSQFKRFNESF